MNKLNELHKQEIRLINIIVGCFGLILSLLAVVVGFLKSVPTSVQSILFGIGCSLIATSISTWMTSSYIINRSEVEDLLNEWQLKNIFNTKSEMNIQSNKCLEYAHKQVDIVAIGMTTFLNYKGHLLEKKLRQNVKIRIISCNNVEMLRQRESDESFTGASKPNGTMKREVETLKAWVDKNKNIGDINIKFHPSYPGYSYLRIDDHVFWGPNLPLYKSQQNIAFEFGIYGEGGQYLTNFFESLWNNEKLCTDKLEWKQGVEEISEE